jgi:peptidoglycan DL-endopeptidase CwlO
VASVPFGGARHANPPPLAGFAARGAARARRAPGLDLERARLVGAARRRVGEPFRGDCSGFVLAALRDARVRVPPLPAARSRSASLWLACRPVEKPRPGDLAFFHDTYDRDRDGRLDDRFTHVAVVERVEGRRVVLVHRNGSRVERLRMSLDRPGDADQNDVLRVKRRGDAPGTRYLAGELFAAFGALLGDTATPKLQAGHGAVDSVRHPASR